jgi:hypothetical protein
MSQDDLSVANASGATVRADINANIQALGTLMAGTSAPSTTYAGMWWLDTTNHVLKRRNEANTAWMTVAKFDETNGLASPYAWNAAMDEAYEDIASAATTNLATPTSRNVRITGTTTITAFGTVKAGSIRHLRFAGALTLTHNATSLILPGGANIVTAADDTATVVSLGSGNWLCLAYKRQSGLPVVQSAGLPRSYLAGAALANNGTDPTNDIDIAVGAARDSTNAVDIAIPALTKRLDAGWAAGTNQGMRNSAAGIANTTYHLYAVAKANGADPDIYAVAGADGTDPDSSAAVASAITALQAETGGGSYIYARRIGSILRVSGAILAFSQFGDEFLLSAAKIDIDDDDPGTSAVLRTLSVPRGLKAGAIVMAGVYNGTANDALYVSSPDQADEACHAHTTAALANAGLTVWNRSAAAAWVTAGRIVVLTNRSRQIRTRHEAGGATNRTGVVTYGWHDLRGRAD